MALPNIPPGPDMVAAIIIESDAVLLLRVLGHRRYCVLPSGYVEESESLEAACMRCALASVRGVADELATQLKADLGQQNIALEVGPKIGAHSWGGGRLYHYFLAVGNRQSILAGPESQPQINPASLVWMPYEWVPFDQLSTRNLQPPEAVDICKRARALRLTSGCS